MARMRRRGRWKKVAPDRGWFVLEATETIDIINGGTPYAFFAPILTMADIDSDPDVIRQDKSDWVVKRILYDAWWRYNTQTVTNFPAAYLQHGLVVARDDAASALEAAGVAPISVDVYDRCDRVLHTDARFVSRLTAHTFDAGGAQQTTTGANANTHFLNGLADMHAKEVKLDLKVNFGLRSEVSLYHMSGWTGGDPTFNPQTDGDITWYGFWRMLLQKRRT